MGKLEGISRAFLSLCKLLIIITCFLFTCRHHGSYHGGGRRKMDPKEQAELHAKKRKEREKIASRGVPEVWAASPPRPELE